ncbi:MAG: hypothetical protein EXR66_03355 [Dehalococcoidia bacterium]|nr:hypothetical protein [Dehalococcoidia bacterium]
MADDRAFDRTGARDPQELFAGVRMRNPLLLSRSEVPLRASPILGSSTSEVLYADLGLSGADIAALEACGAIGLEQR